MKRTAATRRERFLPYRYARSGVALRVTGCVLDGEDMVEPDTEAHLVELDVPWNAATVQLELTVPAATLARVLPEGQEGGGTPDETELLLVLRCPSTFVRAGVRVPFARADVPVSTELALRRDDLAGALHLQAFLVRKSAGRRRRGFASRTSARLADSRAWELRVDCGREPRGEYLDVRYRRFSEDDAIPARDRKNLYALDVAEDAPILWINAEHERIAAILDSKGNVGRHARLREVFFDHIAHAVWTQLFLRAARHYVETEDTVFAWEDGVLDALLKDAYPEVRSAADRRDRLAEDWDDLPELLRRLDAGLQRRDDLAVHLTKLVEEETGK